MNFANVVKIARHEWQIAFRNRILLAATVILGLAMLAALYIGWQNYQTLNRERAVYQQTVADQWRNQPDRHPHRAAHYGYLVFRPKSSLSFFDAGVDSYAGTIVFLEAHRQNSANSSEAANSSGIVRFGELNLAMILQLLVPLLIFFLGFSAITSERENGTLSLILSQGASWREILLGKTLGIVSLVYALLAPIVALAVLLWLALSDWQIETDLWLRSIFLLAAYAIYFAICAGASILVSAFCRTSRSALTILIVVWILFLVVLPRAVQNLGASFYPTASKAEFDKTLEDEMSKYGDSHNPNDPQFAELKRETLQKYGVADVKDLPFNYSGFVMGKAEEISSNVFRERYSEVLEQFQRQNSVSEIAGFVNPFLSAKNFSMAMAGTDLANYEDFQWQAEEYRYRMIQKLNDFHANEIEAANDRNQKANRAVWNEFPAFQFEAAPVAESLAEQKSSVAALLLWLVGIACTLCFVRPPNAL